VKKILITGANGFIGSYLCASLLEAGYEVVGAARKKQGLAAGVKFYKIEQLGSKTDWGNCLDGVDYVIHLAALVHQMENTKGQESLYQEINIEGTRRLAKIAASKGVRRFIFASSVKAMAGATPVDKPMTERGVFNPDDDYGKSKLESERVLAKICSSTEMEWLILRLPLVYGPGVKGNMYRLLRLVHDYNILPFGKVNNKRGMIFIGNLVALIMESIGNPNAANETFLVSDNDDLSTSRLIQLIASSMENKSISLIPVPGGVYLLAGGILRAFEKITGSTLFISAEALSRLTGSLAIDSSHCQKSLNWSPPYSVEQGIREMVDWYLGVEKNN
jgi:nucleoside-diphosphate-sugar epimerase